MILIEKENTCFKIYVYEEVEKKGKTPKEEILKNVKIQKEEINNKYLYIAKKNNVIYNYINIGIS